MLTKLSDSSRFSQVRSLVLSVSYSVTYFGGAKILLTALTPKPVATVKMVNGDTHIITMDTAQFGYAVVFSNYVRGDNAKYRDWTIPVY